jgi:hypothetical protein
MFVFGFPNTNVPLPNAFMRPMFAVDQDVLVKLEGRQHNGKAVNVVEIPSMKLKHNVLLSDLKPVSSTTPVPKDWQALVSAAIQYQPSLANDSKKEEKEKKQVNLKKRKEPPAKEAEEEDEEEEATKEIVTEKKEEKKEMKPRPPSAYRLFLLEKRNYVPLGDRPKIKEIAAKWKLMNVHQKRPYVLQNRNLLRNWRAGL